MMKYIEHNDHVKHIQYGFFSSAYNGCGWIAVYNFLQGENRAPAPEKVAKYMEKYLFLGGILGTSLDCLLRGLRHFGVKPKVYTRLDENVLKADRIILYYGYGARNMFKRHFGYAERHEGEVFKYKNPTIKAEPLRDHVKRIDPTFIKYIIAERNDK